jgi:hypothetical protein
MSTTGPKAAKAATGDKHGARTGLATQWRDRVEAAHWDTIRSELDSFGCALTGPLLAPDEAADIAALYTDDSRFRSTINMGRYRFGEGEYRYFSEPFPEAVIALKQATSLADRCRRPPAGKCGSPERQFFGSKTAKIAEEIGLDDGVTALQQLGLMRAV